MKYFYSIEGQELSYMVQCNSHAGIRNEVEVMVLGVYGLMCVRELC